MQDPSDGRAVAALFDGPKVLKVRKPWREEYELMPMNGAMVDGMDISDREFNWRPKDLS